MWIWAWVAPRQEWGGYLTSRGCRARRDFVPRVPMLALGFARCGRLRPELRLMFHLGFEPCRVRETQDMQMILVCRNEWEAGLYNCV